MARRDRTLWRGQGSCLEEDLRGDLGRAALLEQANRLVQVSVGPGDLVREFGLVATSLELLPSPRDDLLEHVWSRALLGLSHIPSVAHGAAATGVSSLGYPR